MLGMGMKLNSLQDLFENELKDVYDAENQIIDAIPKMIDAASSQDVKDKFIKHLDTTKTQASRLEDVFGMLDMEPERQHCDGMAGIIKDGQKIVSAHGDPNVKDAGLIAAAQKVEHYEIASYGTLRTFANTLGMPDVADKLQTTREEESRSDETLTQVAERGINRQAAA